MSAWRLTPGTWHLAFGAWYSAFGTWATVTVLLDEPGLGPISDACHTPNGTSQIFKERKSERSLRLKECGRLGSGSSRKWVTGRS
jgi:hypothetical protein